MRKYLMLTAALVLSSCGLSESNALPEDGPIANPAVEAGLTQAQGASSGQVASLADQGLRLEVDDEVVDITSAEQLEELVANTPPQNVDAVPHCAEILNVAPAGDIQRCSYTPDAVPLITDTLLADQCDNGQALYTLNRPSGEGAFVGVHGLYWVELDRDEYSVGSVTAICNGATG